MKRNEFKCFLSLLLCVALTSGCTHASLRSSKTGRATLPAGMAAEYTYVREAKPAATVKVLEEQSKFAIKRVELSAPGDGADGPRTITLDYYAVSGDGKTPVILVLPMLGGGYGLERHFASYFASRGYAAVIVHREKVDASHRKMEYLNPMLKQTVLDHKRVIDWLETRPELNCSCLGVFGVSMGGIKGALLTPLESRIQAAALGLVGGDLPYILAHSTEKGLIKMRDETLREQNLTLAEAEERLHSMLTCDPMVYAPYVDPRKILLVLARYDTVVPIEKGLELKEKMGNPETIMIPAGHFSAVLSIPYIKSQSFDFFEKRFAEVAGEAHRTPRGGLTRVQAGRP